jgi:hypothetical protein
MILSVLDEIQTFTPEYDSEELQLRSISFLWELQKCGDEIVSVNILVSETNMTINKYWGYAVT